MGDGRPWLYLLLQSINQLFYFAKSINLQIKSRPNLKGKTHFLNEKNQKVSRFLKARKWSPYAMLMFERVGIRALSKKCIMLYRISCEISICKREQ